MWIGRLRREIKELSRDCARAADDEEMASFELTRSARAFSQRARETADDTLAFSATLMRAGEVGAANRLIHDLERDVHTEEAALAEQLNEVKVAAATRRSKMTRLRLVRTLAAAVLAAGLLSFSAAGMAVASFLADLQDTGDGSAAQTESRVGMTGGASARDATTRSIRLPDGTRVTLTRSQFRALKVLAANPKLDRGELERLLIELVGPKVADRLASVIADVAGGASQAAGELGSTAGGAVGARAEEVESNVRRELGSSPTGGAAPSSKGPESDEHEPVEKPGDSPERPKDDDGIIDKPLGAKPEKPPVLGGD